ncbi:hypothetical protein RP726_00940 [Candidatus Methylospira mobilis]|uniref:hypothetical protein n=1 Tax=Candidatus Methylospira mobilis TaxID=1808979 RepID=UPI00188516DD|nr:hypothetical protein [Candidatus Methylospira mobilis]WNV04995.1 hypothetical protein RP726_00940 [Candidatus Methylospira mobilis]
MDGRTLHVTRLNKGLSTTHPLRGDELRLLRVWLAGGACEDAAGNGGAVHQRTARGVVAENGMGADAAL